MATKRPQGAAGKAADANVKAAPKQPPKQPARSAPAPSKAPVLTSTETPGVFRNSKGILCNDAGIAIDLLQLRTMDRARFGAIIDGEIDTPAKFLKAVALDPLQPLMVRIDAAKSAAPYFDRKTPVSVDGGLGTDGSPTPVNLAVLASMSKAELESALVLLSKLGVAV